MKTGRSLVCLIATLLSLALLVTSTSAQELASPDSTSTRPKVDNSYKTDVPTNPLKPADTSSPRDTLRSFLTDIHFLIRDWQQHGSSLSTARYLAFKRALSTLDLSTTPDNDSRMIMSIRVIMLHEILARITLPPDSEIPGDEDIADSALNQWTIPGSRITFQRIENGPHTGDFFFSAWTVQRIPRFYRQVKHLPYRPDAIPGIYEEALLSKRSIADFEGAVRNRLKPIDTSSPRSTFNGFLDSVNSAYALVRETEAALKASPPTVTINEASETETRALNLLMRAQATFDLSKVPTAVRADIGIESVLQLKEIFDRMYLPAIESVPDMEMVNVERQRLSSTATGNTRPVRWRYPNTTIEITEIMDGERQGQFLFSADTVRRLNQFYEKVQDLPYRADYPHMALEYLSPETSNGFYEDYIATPGQLIPQTSFIGRWVEGMPGWFKTMCGSQTIWQWILLVLTVSLGMFFLVVLRGILLRRSSKLSPSNHHWRRVLFNLAAIGMLYALSGVLDETVNLTGSVLWVVNTSLTAFKWYFLATGVLFLSNAIAETIIASPKIDPEGIQASYIRALFGVFGLTTMTVLMVTGLFQIGVSLGPLLASVGIGGLAIALAARPTLENVIGSFMILLDKPYRVGQRIKVLGQDGKVESIGLRSTKIRLLSGHLTSIPNEKMATVEIENIGQRPYIRRCFNVTVTYDTPPEKINRGVEILKEILAVPKTPDPGTSTTEGQEQPHPNEAINRTDYPPRVYFNDLNADSLNIVVFYWYHPAEYWYYLEHAHWINIQIMERFNTEGIDFAFPTQTLHLAGDEKRPLTVGQCLVSQEEDFSPNAILAQAAALGAQAVYSPQTPASDAVRPIAAPSKPKTHNDLTDAPIEEGLLHGDDEAEGDGGEK